MRDFFKGVWDRVVGSYKTTLIGVGLGVAIIFVDQFTTLLQGIDKPWATVAATLVALLGAFLKGKVSQPVPPADPT